MGWMPISPWKPIAGTGQNLALGPVSVPSAAFGAQTYAIAVSALGNCHIRLGQAPVAVATDTLVKASDPPLILKVSPGEKLAVIQDAAATGNLNITELTH